MLLTLARLLALSVIAIGAHSAAAGPDPDQPVPADPKCGDRYRAAYDDAVKGGASATAKPDELLYDAAVCYEQAGSTPAAVTAYREVSDRFPASPAARRALGRLAALFGKIGQYAEAAAASEDYARRYPDDAFAALSDAVYYRKQAGDDDQAIADTRLFVKRYAATRPADAANAFFSMGTIYERRGKSADTVEHYRAYVKTWGSKGGDDKLVFAYARIGDLLWHQSCPVKETDGACVRPARPKADHQQCGAVDRVAALAVKRDRTKVKEAQAALALAIAQYERAGGTFPSADERVMRQYYAQARFDLAEADREAVLAVAFPAGLDFDATRPALRRKSDERFAAWFDEKDRLAAKARSAYLALIVEVKDPTYAIAAAARLGQLSLGLADAVLTSAIPTRVRPDPAAVAAYCDRLQAVAEPYEAQAIESFSACKKVSTDIGTGASWASWATVCERELHHLRAGELPTGPSEPGLWGVAPAP